MKAQLIKENGVTYIAADGKIIDTLAFKSFRPTANNVGDFYKAGVRIFHVYCSGLTSALKVPYSLYGETWFGDGDYRWENLDRQIEMFAETAPDAYVFINVHLDNRQWWLDQNPGRVSSFTHLSQVAADEKWRKDTADYLKALIAHVEEKYDEKVLGYFLLGGHTTEWFSDKDFEETHPIKLEAFRKYMGDASVEIPDKEGLERPENQIFLDPEADRLLIDYRIFHADLIADTVLYYCHEAQKVLQHKKLMGVFFGYIMELQNARIWNAGHLANDKVYRSEDIDYIATPSSYQFRNYDDPTAYMILGDTLELNGKMLFDSFDHMTFTVPNLVENTRRICGDEETTKALTQLSWMRKDLLSTREQTIDGMRREMMQRLSRRTGMWWFDMLEGWFYDDGLMAEIKDLVSGSHALLSKKRESVSEIAVFVSCESLYYVNKCSKINTELICRQRGALAKMGAPYDLYSLNDVDRVDKNKYKLWIFLDAFMLTDAQREYINNTVKGEGRSLLFVGACDYINDSGTSLDRVSAMAEMKIDFLPKDEKTINGFDSSYGYDAEKNPTPYVADHTATVLGRYGSSRLCGLACRKKDAYTVYFSGLGNLSHEALRGIAREAGVHIYVENGTASFINSGFAGVYNTRSEFTTLTLKEDGEFKELFSGKVYKTENRKVSLPTGQCPAQMLVLMK